MSTLYIFITGPTGSGKSQFIHSLGDPEGFQIDEERGLEFRSVRVEADLEVVVFTAVDSTRFDQLIAIPKDELLGYIVMVDSTDHDTWQAAQFMMQTCRTYSLLTTVITANKQDLRGAATPEQVGASLGMDSMVSVQPCVATDPESARNVLLKLLYSVENEIDRLGALILEIEKLVAASA